MDCWIKWLIANPKCNLIYWIGAYLLIIKYLIEKNMIFVKKNCEYLYKYYNYFYEKDIC